MLTEIWDHYDIQLNRSSGEAAYKCPLHEDTHASATANLDEEIWFCHVCGVGGDAIKMISLMEGCTFRDAYRISKTILAGSDGEVRGSPQRERGRFDLPGGKRDKPSRRPFIPSWRSR